jgi:hypothetical protein
MRLQVTFLLRQHDPQVRVGVSFLLHFIVTIQSRQFEVAGLPTGRVPVAQ